MKGALNNPSTKVGLYMLLPVVFMLIPTSWLETCRPVCLIRKVFGVPCPGCGMVRAISSVFHGNFSKALRCNKLVVLVLPLLTYTWLRSMVTQYRRYKFIRTHP